MKRAKHAVNDAKFDRVRAVIAQIKDQGRDDDLKASIIARRAGVHRSFVSNHFNAEITHAKSEIQARFISGLTSNTALSAASLRVEMETAKQQAREAQQEIRALKARLARAFGDEVAADTPSTAPPPPRSRRCRMRLSSCWLRRPSCVATFATPRKSSMRHAV